MHAEAMQWIAGHASRGPVLDVGGRDVNGTPRHLFPGEYTVLDMRPAPNVDIVADAATWRTDRRWPVVVCSEVLEHTPQWRAVVRTCGLALAPGGRLIITCAGPGRPEHSAYDGALTLQPGEYYGNVDPAELAAVLKECGMTDVTVDQAGHDVRAVATAPLTSHQISWEPQPFPHAVTDGLWDADRLAAVADEFPSPDSPAWHWYGEAHERGKGEGSDPATWGPQTRSMLADMMAMAPELETITGIEQLTADTYGGGMHMTGEGGRLAMHRDFNIHPQLRLERRLNFLVFLNPVWERNWGGVLYLGRHREVEILPVANRTAIFACTGKSWHGHPEPVTGEHWRKSLACYFYAPLRPPLPQQGTIWLSEDGHDG